MIEQHEKAAKVTEAMQAAISTELNTKAKAAMKEFLAKASEASRAKFYDLLIEHATPAEALKELGE